MKSNNRIKQEKLKEFLQIVDNHFPVPLSAKVDLEDYARKLINRADLIAELSDTGEIQALVAGYVRHVENNMAYIAIVATIPEMRGQGKAKRVVQRFMDYCQEQKRKGVHLYAAESNTNAVRLYESLGFERFYLENEPRPDDLHLVHWFDKEDKT